MNESGGVGAVLPCSLTWPEQRRNMLLFAACTGLQYLAAPVLYVGITQAALCDRLGADARASNLPGTLYFAMTAMPALIAWLSPGVAQLKRNMSLCYGVSALMLATMAVTLMLPVSHAVKVGLVAVQGAVSGAVMPAAIALLWEAIGRGADESRRGVALGLAFGVGPLLAVIGSFGQTMLLGGNLFGLQFDGVAFPMNFVALFGLGAPLMAAAACLSLFFVIPAEKQDVSRESISAVAGLLIGLAAMCGSLALLAWWGAAADGFVRAVALVLALVAAAAFIIHFRQLLSQRVLLIATVVTVLVYAGNVIPSNMNLYSTEALGAAPEKYAGVQNMLRFSFKVVAGLLLGWLLTRTNPRAGILATSSIFLLSQLWAMLVTGPWYLLAFGIHGAGELVGVYAPNYILSASRRADLRRNMAFVTMLMVPAAPAGYLYGSIVEGVKSAGWTAFGIPSAALGFRLSFLVCAVLISCGILLALVLLPARPRPEESESE